MAPGKLHHERARRPAFSNEFISGGSDSDNREFQVIGELVVAVGCAVERNFDNSTSLSVVGESDGAICLVVVHELPSPGVGREHLPH